MTADQHKDVVSKTLGLANVAGASLTALADSGMVGQGAATNIKNGVAAVESTEGLAGLLAAAIAKLHAAFSWI